MQIKKIKMIPELFINKNLNLLLSFFQVPTLYHPGFAKFIMHVKFGHYMGNSFMFKRINDTDNCGSNFPNGTYEKGELHQQDCCTNNPIYSLQAGFAC